VGSCMGFLPLPASGGSLGASRGCCLLSRKGPQGLAVRWLLFMQRHKTFSTCSLVVPWENLEFCLAAHDITLEKTL
jgi:hypothetical protein